MRWLKMSLKTMWKKTIFPDMIKNYKLKQENKKLEQDARNKMMQEARMEAISESKDDMIKMYKQQEIDKMTKKKGNALQKIGNEFSEFGNNMLKKDMNIEEKFGVSNGNGNMMNLNSSKDNNNDFSKKIKRMLE